MLRLGRWSGLLPSRSDVTDVPGLCSAPWRQNRRMLTDSLRSAAFVCGHFPQLSLALSVSFGGDLGAPAHTRAFHWGWLCLVLSRPCCGELRQFVPCSPAVGLTAGWKKSSAHPGLPAAVPGERARGGAVWECGCGRWSWRCRGLSRCELLKHRENLVPSANCRNGEGIRS